MDIIKAEWGTQDKYIDITQKANELYKKHGFIEANNKNFGDPVIGKRKQLKLHEKDKIHIAYENTSFYEGIKAVEQLKKWNIKEQYIYDAIKNQKTILISKKHIRVNIYYDTDKCIITTTPFNGSGLYCYVHYYLDALNHAKPISKHITVCTKDGWSLYKNKPDDDLYYQLFCYNSTGKNDLEKYFHPSVKVTDTITLLKSKYDIDPSKTIGVMARGTDKITERVLPIPEQYIAAVNDKLKDNPDHKILLQTDEQPIADLFLKTYGDKLILIDEIPRSNDGKNVFHRELDNKIQICVYLDAVMRIISECQCVVKTFVNHGGICGIIEKYRGNGNGIISITHDQ